MRKLKWILLSAVSLLSLGCVHKTLTDSAGSEPGEEGTVHIFVQCTQVRNLDLMDKATFVLSNLYARKDGRRVKIPFAGSVQGNILTGDILSYELYAHGESCDHTLTLLISTKDGRYILKDMDVSDQILAQKEADEIYLVIDQEIDLADDGSEGLKPGEEGVVHIFVNCLNVSGLDQVSQAAYGLSNLRARKGGEPVTLPFAADIRNGVLAGDVLSYGHCAQGETCQHTLSLFVRLKDGTDKLIEIDVSAQMDAQRGTPIIFILIADEIRLDQDPPYSPEPGEKDGVHIFVTCTNVTGADKIDNGVFTLSNLYAKADGDKTTLPFVSQIQDGALIGYVWSQRHCPETEVCDHTLTLLMNLKGGGQHIAAFNVSSQMQAQRKADVIFIVISNEINLDNPDIPEPPVDPEPPIPGTDEDVQIHVTCTQVRHTERIVSATFTLSNLYAVQGGYRVTLPFIAEVGEGQLKGEVMSRGHCKDAATCSHRLLLLICLENGDQKMVGFDVSDQMRSQLDSKDISIIITDEIVPENLVDFTKDEGGGIIPLDPSESFDVS